MAENDSAQRARQVADREHGERQHQGRQRPGGGKEGRADVLGEHAVNDEIVELECAAQARQDDHAPLLALDSGWGDGRLGCHEFPLSTPKGVKPLSAGQSAWAARP